MALDNFMDDKQKRMLVFTLTSIMQVAFLSGEYSKEIIGYDLYKKEERDLFIDTVVEMLFDGIVDRWK